MNTLIDTETKCALVAQSLREAAWLDGKQVHVTGSLCETAELWLLHTPWPDTRGQYNYDPIEAYRVEWDVVQEVLGSNTRTFSLHQVQRRRKHTSWDTAELHLFGITTRHQGIMRFAAPVDDDTLVRLTRYSGLPPHWLCWHQQTTYGWPYSLDYYPVITRGAWLRFLMGKEPEWENTFLLVQDPIPLLQQFASYIQATKTLRVISLSLKEANHYVKLFHRHSAPVHCAKYALAAFDAAGQLHGVAILGRPVARLLAEGNAGEMHNRVIEVVRVATDGTRNVNSLLYGAARRLAKEAGYERIITYILATEEGTSLKADGWTCVAAVRGQQWHTPSRPRKHNDLYSLPKFRWECDLHPPRPFDFFTFPTDPWQAASKIAHPERWGGEYM